MKNNELLHIVLEYLNLQLHEEFKIKFKITDKVSDTLYKFTESNLLYFREGKWFKSTDYIIVNLLFGVNEVIKLEKPELIYWKYKGKTFYIDKIPHKIYGCSKCQYEYMASHINRYKYCPNCGSVMTNLEQFYLSEEGDESE